MSEPKRVALTTISTTVTPSSIAAAPVYRAVGASGSFGANKATSALFGSNGPDNEDGVGKQNNTKTFRLDLTLFQTDSSSYPEFNYSRLVHLEKKKLKKLRTLSNGFTDHPLTSAIDDDVARIARELEKKYGSAYGSGRSRKSDIGDKGMGYDESDSFIDNTEAYDEVIPEEVETIEGGFYINCGALEFKKLQTELTTTKTDEIIKMPNRPKKRMLSSSSSEDSSTTEEEDEVDDEEEEDDDSSTTNNRQKSGNSSSSTTASVAAKNTQTLKEKQKNGLKSIGLSFSSSNSPKPLGEEIGSDSDKDRVPIKTITVKDMLKAKRDSFLKSQGNEAKANVNGQDKSSSGRTTDDEDQDSTSSTDDSEDSDRSAGSVPWDKKINRIENIVPTNTDLNTEKAEVKLPAGLDTVLLNTLHSFKDGALAKGMLGKKFQFDERLEEQFLKIDEFLVDMDKTKRNLVLAFLDFHLQQPRYYFLRKAKQLRIKEAKQKNKRALAKLNKAVIEAMPAAIAEYEVELRKCADLNANTLNADQPPIMPKKEFPWTHNLRNLLHEVFEVRSASHSVLRTRKESIEDFTNNYLRIKVVDVWPNGWMRYEDLQREIDNFKNGRHKTKENKKIDTTETFTTTSTAQINNLLTAALTSKVPPMVTTKTASKRKLASISESTKPRKNKSQKKDNIPSDAVSNNKKFITPTAEATNYKPVDFSANLKQQASTSALQAVSAAFNTFQQQQQQLQSQQQQHSGSVKATHVIDLDNYKSANDILQTSKQLINAAQQQQQQKQNSKNAALLSSTTTNYKLSKAQQNDSSSESDGVEIVGVYHQKLAHDNNAAINKPSTINKNVETIMPNIFIPHSASLFMSTATTTTTKSFNNNGTAVNQNSPGSQHHKRNGKNDLDNMDVKKVLRDLKGLDQLQLPTGKNFSIPRSTTAHPQ